jgi:hypothetical protein
MGKTTVEIIQMKDVNAPPRLEADFLKYFSNKKPVDAYDNHCQDNVNPSPLYGKFPLIKGFAMEPMHTVYGGCFLRWLTGLVSERLEGIYSLVFCTT